MTIITGQHCRSCGCTFSDIVQSPICKPCVYKALQKACYRANIPLRTIDTLEQIRLFVLRTLDTLEQICLFVFLMFLLQAFYIAYNLLKDWK